MMLPPDSVEALASAVRDAAGRGAHLVPTGAGTRQYLSGAPAAGALPLPMMALDRLLEHVPADMTVAVEAGMPLGRLQALLREHNQWLPWDPPAPPEATIGGLLATAASGPLRYGYGTPRDWLLGMRVVLGDGRIVKSGGRVVKNVAGYDTHKLQLGAFGTLGVIAEVTMKVFPRPETLASVVVSMPDLAAAQRCAERFRASPLAPVSLIIRVPGDAGISYDVAARYAGVPAAVQRQVEVAAATAPSSNILTGSDEQAFWAHVAAFARPHADEQALIVRAAARPADLDNLLALLHRCAPGAMTAIGYGGVGVAYARWLATNTTAAALVRLRSGLAPYGGYAVVEHVPDAVAAIDRWGVPPPTLQLMHALRRQWDPAETLNRGRYM